MVFKYKWSDKKNGNFAIKKRNSKGIRIEPKRNQQTKDSHYFILVNENDTDSMYNALRGLNIILETINFDYRQKGTDKKSRNPYLTKEDIENVLNNIDQYKNKTITIEITPPNEPLQKGKKLIDENNKKIKSMIQESYGDNQYDSLINMLLTSIRKKQELKEKQLETEKEIKELNKILLEKETTINADIEKLEKAIFSILKTELKNLQYKDGVGNKNFQNFLKPLYYLAEKERRNKEASKRQKKYRDKKPKQKRGRPRKTDK